jgi:prepilin-type processing-associated H-X9-DG protein
MYGERITSPNNPPKGLMIYDTTFQKREVTDGIAQTIIVSEDSTNSGGEWINGLNVFDQAYAINQAPAIENDMRSEHKGGVNSLFADGSVKFLNQYMDLKIVAAICTREGGELIDRNAIE